MLAVFVGVGLLFGVGVVLILSGLIVRPVPLNVVADVALANGPT